MDVEVPSEAELLNSLTKVTQWYIYNDCQRNQTEKQ